MCPLTNGKCNKLHVKFDHYKKKILKYDNGKISAVYFLLYLLVCTQFTSITVLTIMQTVLILLHLF